MIKLFEAPKNSYYIIFILFEEEEKLSNYLKKLKT